MARSDDLPPPTSIEAAACRNAFIEPKHFQSLVRLLPESCSITQRQNVLWALASTLPCQQTADIKTQIELLKQYLIKEPFSLCVSFIFRKLSEDAFLRKEVPKDVWLTLAESVQHLTGNQGAQTNIVNALSNILQDMDKVALQTIRDRLETLSQSVAISNRCLAAVLHVLRLLVVRDISMKTVKLDRISTWLDIDDEGVGQRARELLEVLDVTDGQSAFTSPTWMAPVVTEIAAIHHQSISNVEELIDPKPKTEITFPIFEFLKSRTAQQSHQFRQMSVEELLDMATADKHSEETRERYLLALTSMMKQMSNEESISEHSIERIGKLLNEKSIRIREAAAIVLCCYASDRRRHLSNEVLEKLGSLFVNSDYLLVTNILSVYFSIAREKGHVPSCIAAFLRRPEPDLREKTIEIIEKVVANGQKLTLSVLDELKNLVHDSAFHIRNRVASVFIESCRERLVEETVIKRLDALLSVFQRPFQLKVRISALELVKQLILKCDVLSDSLLQLIELALGDRENSIVQTTIDIIKLYATKSKLSKRITIVLEHLFSTETAYQFELIKIFISIVGKGQYLSEKIIEFLGHLLWQSDHSPDILPLLTRIDRNQPLPLNVNDLLREHYLLQVLQNSIYSDTKQIANDRLQSLTRNGHRLSKAILQDIVDLIKAGNNQTELLKVLVHVTANGQHLNEPQMKILQELFCKKPTSECLLRIFCHLIRYNQILPDNIMNAIEQSIKNGSINNDVIQIYYYLIEREKSVKESTIKEIFSWIEPIKWATLSKNCRYQLVRFLQAVAKNQPELATKVDLSVLLQSTQSTQTLRSARETATVLKTYRQTLTPNAIDALNKLIKDEKQESTVQKRAQQVLGGTPLPMAIPLVNSADDPILNRSDAYEQKTSPKRYTKLQQSRLATKPDPNDSATDTFLAALKAGRQLPSKHQRIIEAKFTRSPTVKLTTVIRLLAEQQKELKKETFDTLLAILLKGRNKQYNHAVTNTSATHHRIPMVIFIQSFFFYLFNLMCFLWHFSLAIVLRLPTNETLSDAFTALEHAARHQRLPTEIHSYFLKQCSSSSADIVRRSLTAIRYQLMRNDFIWDPSEQVPQKILSPSGVPLDRLEELEDFDVYFSTIQTLHFVEYVDEKIFAQPVERWSREFLCYDLLARVQNKTPVLIGLFHHHLALLEQFHNFGLYSDERDLILQALIERQQRHSLTLEKVNQIVIYLFTWNENSKLLLRSTEADWLKKMRRIYVEEKFEQYWPKGNQLFPIDELVKLKSLTAEWIGLLLQIVRNANDVQLFSHWMTEYQLSVRETTTLFTGLSSTDTIDSLGIRMKRVVLQSKIKSICRDSATDVNRAGEYFQQLMNKKWSLTAMEVLIKSALEKLKLPNGFENFLTCLNLLADYPVEDNLVRDLQRVFQDFSSESWPEKVHQMIIEDQFASHSMEKSRSTLIKEITQLNSKEISQKLKESMKRIDRAFQSDSVIFPQKKSIDKWQIADIRSWARGILEAQEDFQFNNHLMEILAVVQRAVYLHCSFELRTAQLLSVLIILHSKQLPSRRLLQVCTGEGKSIITAIVAVIKALEHKHVDIITSSMDLAQRDAEKRESFYSMFHRTASYNADRRDSFGTVKSCYRDNIVYGDASHFRFDVLRDEFALQNTRANRRFDVLIVDEVDNMFIDESKSIAYLNDKTLGTDWLNPVLFGIWVSIKDRKDVNSVRDLIVDNWKRLINDPQSTLKVPRHLRDFVLDSIPTWVDQGIRAKTEYKLHHHYTIKTNENDVKCIVPIDYSNTGEVQINRTWSDGLQQFLQLKHGLKTEPINLTTNWMSNFSLLSRYDKKEIYGLSGTLGSIDSRQLLQKIYDVDSVIIPPFREKRHVQLRTVLSSSEDQWLSDIVSSTVLHGKQRRAVLIICETQFDAIRISKQLQHVESTLHVHLCTDNTDQNEWQILRKELDAGDIIVATNLAGRGTDLLISSLVQQNGGLHICLTFLTRNLRVEEQAIGRTSRQGQRGTSQLILDQQRTYRQLASLHQLTIEESKRYLADPIALIHYWRGKTEETFLKQISDEHMLAVKEKDQLFRKFCELLSHLRKQSENKHRLASVNERWALWVQSAKCADREKQAFQQRLVQFRFKLVKTHLGENGLFDALSHQLPKKFTVDEIKRQAIDHVHAKFHLYNAISDEERYSAISRALNINMFVIRSDMTMPWIFQQPRAQYTCWVGYEVYSHYVSLQPIDPTETFFEPIDDELDELPTVEHTVNLSRTLFTNMLIPDLRMDYSTFQQTINDEYLTDEIIRNPCYLVHEAEEILESISIWKSIAHFLAPTEMESSAEKIKRAIARLNRAIALDPIFAFNASVTRAYVILLEKQSPTEYKVQAKKCLRDAQEQIGQYLLPTLHSMQALLKDDQTEMNASDALAKQLQAKVEIFYLYYSKLEEALQSIEQSQKLVDVSVKNGQSVRFGRKLYHQEVQDFVDSAQGTIGLSFHSLTVHSDVFTHDQALNLLGLIAHNGQDISIDFPNATLESMEKIVSTNTVTVNIPCLEQSEVRQLISGRTIDLTVQASIEDYRKAIEAVTNDVIIETESREEEYSPTGAKECLSRNANVVRSIRFRSLDATSVEKILNSAQKGSFTVQIDQLQLSTVRELIEKIQKSFSLHYRKLTKSEASNLISNLTERHFILNLENLSSESALGILKKFDRNEQDVTVQLISMTEFYTDTNRPKEELILFQSMMISRVIVVNENNPRPWVSICIVSLLGAAQIAVGVYLAACTAGLGVNLGISLINEGVSDIFYAIHGAVNRQFSWKSYAVQKGVSVAICIGSLGFSAYSQAGSIRGAGVLIKNSARVLGKEAVKGFAKNSLNLAVRQACIILVEYGASELINAVVDTGVEQMMSQLRSTICSKVEEQVLPQLGKGIFIQVFIRAAAVDLCYEHEIWLNRAERIAVQILTEEKSRLLESAESLLTGLSKSILQQCRAKQKSGSTVQKYLFAAEVALFVGKCIKEAAEIPNLAEKFLDVFEQKLREFQSTIPTFADILVKKSNGSIESCTATDIYQSLVTNQILDVHGTIHSSITNDRTTSNQKNELSARVARITLIDKAHKKYIEEVLSKILPVDKNAFAIDRVNKKIINLLSNHIIRILQGTLIGSLTHLAVNHAVHFLSENLQRRHDPRGTVAQQLHESGAQRLISMVLTDLKRDIQNGKVQLDYKDTQKLEELKMKCHWKDFRVQDDTEQLALDVIGQKQGGIIEIALLAALTGTTMNIIQNNEQSNGSINMKEGCQLIYKEPYVDPSTGIYHDGHYETTNGSTGAAGVNDCLYISVLEQMPGKFASVQDMRDQCASLILACPELLAAIKPSIDILNSNPDPCRRGQLIIEGGARKSAPKKAVRATRIRPSDEEIDPNLLEILKQQRKEVLMPGMLQSLKKNPEGLEDMNFTDQNGPTIRYICRRINSSSDGRSVQRTEYYSVILTDADYRRSGRDNFPRSGATSRAHLRNYLHSQSLDERGHIISNAVGGVSEPHNMTPQHPSVNRNVGLSGVRGTWYGNEIQMRDFLRDGQGFVRHEVFMVYPDLQTGRPSEFQWRTRYYSRDNIQLRDIEGSMKNSGPF
ncbi:unnamed protein product [Adineta ricciae]|uniref:Protein translocase subunit SecA n=1 Tax=Adineta ricciae TaxID=249248 RepID=A0A813RX78_ADIRI|nr:unnamed protein product [Adineta ricciae]CAF0791437.1 unnamed protein product [Adineta ricciae]